MSNEENFELPCHILFSFDINFKTFCPRGHDLSANLLFGADVLYTELHLRKSAYAKMFDIIDFLALAV